MMLTTGIMILTTPWVLGVAKHFICYDFSYQAVVLQRYKINFH